MRDNPNLSEEQIDRIRSVASFGRCKPRKFFMNPRNLMRPCLSCWKVTSRLAGRARTTRFSRFVKQTSSPARCPSFPGKRSLLKARVTADGSVLELSRDKVLSLMAKDTELGEIFMEAFVAQRL